MKSMLATFNSDQVNRYGYRFSVEALESTLRQAWKGAPMFVSHDYHRPLGVSRALGLHIHSSQVLLKGIATYAETTEENQELVEMAQAFLAAKLNEIDDADRVKLTTRLAEHMSASAVVVRRECVSALDQGIAKRMFPDLFRGDETDKRSLTPINSLKAIGPGVFQVGEYAVFAHRYYRRSLSQINNLNGIFLEKLYGLKDVADLDVKIALDADSVGLASTYLTPMELEYWRGPKFNDDLSAIKFGVTCHKASDRQRYFHGIERTEFWWHRLNDKNSLECEEVLDQASFGINEDTYGCRYVHSMVDEATNLPDHLDGAIREYGSDAFLERIDRDISRAGKNTRYVKLWIVNGHIQLTTWKELIGDFFRGNPLPGEYLQADAKEPLDAAEASRIVEDDSERSDLYPFRMREDDSAHIAVSYHDMRRFHSDHDCWVKSFETLTVGDTTYKVIELTALELIKAAKAGLSGGLTLPDDASFIDFHDLDINFPIFLFQGQDSLSDAAKFVQCLSEICRHYADADQRRFITSSVGVRYDQTMVVFSFAGFAPQLSSALSKAANRLPPSFGDIGAWCSEIQAILRSDLQIDRMTKDGLNLLRSTGCFLQPRSFSITEMVTIKDDGQISVRLPKSESVIAQAMHDGHLHARPTFLVKACKCSKCNGSYFDCTCSTLFDPDCIAMIEDCEILSFFLTERPV